MSKQANHGSCYGCGGQHIPLAHFSGTDFRLHLKLVEYHKEIYPTHDIYTKLRNFYITHAAYYGVGTDLLEQWTQLSRVHIQKIIRNSFANPRNRRLE